MIAVGAAAVWLWRKRAGPEYFLYGTIFWAAAIAVKITMDLAVTPQLKALLPPAFSGTLILSLYYGLRTGIFESGIPFAAARLAKMAPTFDQAAAVGIGSGAAEAVVLGALSLVNVLAFILLPGLIASYPPGTQAALQLQSSLAFVPIPVWERLFTLFCHVFGTVLALYALRAGWRWLGLSILFMTLLDGVAVLMLVYVTTRTYAGNVVIEAFVGAMGLVSIAGLYVLKGRYDKHARQA